MKHTIALLLATASLFASAQPLPEVSVGRIERLPTLASTHVDPRPVDGLVKAGRMVDTIVVGVWNNGQRRHSEYMPQKFLQHLPEPFRQRHVEQALAGQPRADAYLRFLVQELKPAIDARYATRPEREHTAIMGSSMGGLISIHAMAELDALYGAYQPFIDQIAKDRGYTAANLMSRVFEGKGHNEKAWAERLHMPLTFLFGTP